MFVIYNKDTTMIYRNGVTGKTQYETKRGAAIARGRFALDPSVWFICDKQAFHMLIEKYETKVNLISGEKFTQSVNTSLCCDPSSETYWSM